MEATIDEWYWIALWHFCFALQSSRLLQAKWSGSRCKAVWSKRNILEPLHRLSCEEYIYLPVEITFSHRRSPWCAMDRGKRLYTCLHKHERTRVSGYSSRCVGDLSRNIFMHICRNHFQPSPFALVRDGPRQAHIQIFGAHMSDRCGSAGRSARQSRRSPAGRRGSGRRRRHQWTCMCISVCIVNCMYVLLVSGENIHTHMHCAYRMHIYPPECICMYRMYCMYLYVSVFPNSIHTYQYIRIQTIPTDTSNRRIHTIHTYTYQYIHILWIHTYTYDIPSIHTDTCRYETRNKIQTDTYTALIHTDTSYTDTYRFNTYRIHIIHTYIAAYIQIQTHTYREQIF